MKNPKLLIGLFALLLSTLACARTGAANSVTLSGIATPTVFSSLPGGETTHTLTHDGRERSYILYVPVSVNWNQPIPLVFVFHGGTGNAISAIRTTGFNAVADKYGFILVYPDGTGRLSDNSLLTWNGGSCCGYAQTNNIDDVGFVRSILADVQSLVNVDTKRIYATGISNGAILSQRLACEASDVFAAIAPVSGTLNFSPCEPKQPVSVLEFHGKEDQHIPYDGGYGSKSMVNVNFTSVGDTINFWTSANGCNPEEQSNSFSDIIQQTWSNCKNSTTVELLTIVDGGHAWPGGEAGWPDSDQPVQTISASQLIWDFFAAHPKQ